MEVYEPPHLFLLLKEFSCFFDDTTQLMKFIYGLSDLINIEIIHFFDRSFNYGFFFSYSEKNNIENLWNRRCFLYKKQFDENSNPSFSPVFFFTFWTFFSWQRTLFWKFYIVPIQSFYNCVILQLRFFSPRHVSRS